MTLYVGSIEEMGQAVVDLVRQTGIAYEDASRYIINEAAYEVQNLAKAYAPVRTGRLRNSIAVRFFNDGMSAEVYTDTPYAVFQELGTRGPYKIRPRRGTHLRFKVGDKVVFAKEVTHPGIPPAYFFGRAVDNVGATIGPRINALASSQVRRYIK